MMSGSKRRRSIMSQGEQSFCPDGTPDFWWGGKTLSSDYDKQCYLEGWHKGQDYHEEVLASEELDEETNE